MKYTIVDGDLILMARQGAFDVIAHGVNCFCVQKKGLAPQMVKAFGCDKYPLENKDYKGDINKLGQIDYLSFSKPIVINAYTQYGYGHPEGDLDYEALILCMRKINSKFLGKHIGLPKIGAGLGGGSWFMIEHIIKKELKDCDVTIVNYKP